MKISKLALFVTIAMAFLHTSCFKESPVETDENLDCTAEAFLGEWEYVRPAGTPDSIQLPNLVFTLPEDENYDIRIKGRDRRVRTRDGKCEIPTGSSGGLIILAHSATYQLHSPTELTFNLIGFFGSSSTLYVKVEE